MLNLKKCSTKMLFINENEKVHHIYFNTG